MEDRTVVLKQKEMLHEIKNKLLDSAAVVPSGAVCAAVHASKSQTPLFLQ